MSAEPIIYGLIFVGVLVLVEGLYLVAFGKSISLNSRVNRRLEMLEKGERRDEVLEKLRKEMQQHMDAKTIPLYSLLSEKAQRAAIAFTPKQLIMIMAGLAFVAFLGLTIGTETDLAVRVLLSIAIGVGAVYFWVASKASKRMGLIEEQLPDAVELMVRSLRVGHPFSNAISIVSKEIQDPLASEFGVIADESAYGRDVGEALKDMAERLDMQDLRFLAVAVTIQQQSGGNLAEILSGLAKVIRARFRLFRRVKAITAEAKWSGKFLSAFPIVALIVINVSDPNYYDDVYDHPLFIPACFAVGIFLIIYRRHPRFLARVRPTQLALWSCLAALAHGAGLMLVPIYLDLCAVAELDTGHRAVRALMGSTLQTAILVALVHTLSMAAAGGIMAIGVYFWLGLKFLSKTWFNLDLVWAISLVAVGAFGVWSAVYE